jgi:hypothetical protein
MSEETRERVTPPPFRYVSLISVIRILPLSPLGSKLLCHLGAREDALAIGVPVSRTI